MKKIRLYSMVFLLAALCLVLSVHSEAANKMWWSTCLTGGTAGCLDSLDGDDLTDGDAAFVVRDNSGTYEIYFYRLEDTAGASESSPTTILPDTNPGNKSWKLAKIFGSGLTINGNVNFQQTDGTPIIIMPTAPTTAGKSGVMQTDDAGVSAWIESSTDCMVKATVGGDAFQCVSPTAFWTIFNTTVFTGTVTGEQLLCGDKTGSDPRIKSCGAKITDNSTALHGIYKDSSGYVADQVLAIDAHAGSATITLIPGICPVIHNASQAAADINNALPALAEGLCFMAQVRTAQGANYWRLTAATGNTVCLDGTCAKDYVQFATPVVANFYTCISGGTSWFCESGRGTATTD